jgi:hypothetical protein
MAVSGIAMVDHLCVHSGRICPGTEGGSPLKIVFVTSVLLLVGCGAAVPEPQVAKPADVAPNPVAAGPAPATVGNPLLDQASRDYVNALGDCNATLDAIPWEQNQINSHAASGKTTGLLITTAVGVIGSIATALVSDANKNSPNNAPPTTLGVSTAGATAIAGIISLYAVGSGTDAQIKSLTDAKTPLDADVVAIQTDCRAFGTDAEKAKTCSQTAAIKKRECLSIGSHFPIAYDLPAAYGGPGTDAISASTPPVAKPAIGETPRGSLATLGFRELPPAGH